MSKEMLNVRCDGWLMDLINEATTAAGAKDRSTWAREALEAGARRELAARTEREPRKRRLGGGFIPTSGVCSHPLTARQDTLRAVICGLCGKQTRSKI